MPTKEVLDVVSSDNEDIIVYVVNEIITIHNTADDATFWQVNINLEDWEAIKIFINKQLIK